MSDPWSYSRLNLFTRCPAAWRMKYVEKLTEQTSPAAIRGTQFHKFAEAYGRHCMDTGQERDYAEARELSASYSPEVRALCVNFSNQVRFNTGLVYRDGAPVERKFEVELPDGLGTLCGRVDLVQYDAEDKALLITDYKSGFGAVDPPELCPPQLLCYGWALVQADFPEAEALTLTYRYAGNGQAHSWEMWAPDMRPSWAVSIIRRIEAETEFRPTPSATACQYCGYTKQCPLVLADSTAHPRNDDEARRLCEVTWATQARVAALKSALKDYTTDRDPLEYAGVQVAGKFPPKSNKRRAVLAEKDGLRDFILSALAADLPLADFVTLKEEKLAKLLHDDFSPHEDDPNPFDTDEDSPELAAVKELLEDKPASKRMTFRLDDAPTNDTET